MTQPPSGQGQWPEQPPQGGGYYQPAPPYQQPAQQPSYYGPPGGPLPKKKHTGRNIVLIVLAVLVVLCAGVGVLVAVSIGRSTTNNAGSSSGGAQGDTQRQATAGLNTPVRDGKFEFVVKSVTCGKTTEGDSTLGKQAQGQFCEAALSVKNIGTEVQTFDGSSQKARGSNGATYNNDTEAEIYANQNTQTFLTEINPGNQVTGVIVFDIPKDAKITSLELHDSPFSGGVVVSVT